MILHAEVCATVIKLNFGVEISKAAGWLSLKRYSLGSFTFSPFNFEENDLVVFPIKLCVCAMCTCKGWY